MSGNNMKFLSILFALICVAVSSHAASPSYDKFKGTGGIVVTTNPPNGDVTIDGNGLGAGKQASSMVLSNIVGLSSTVFTNVPLGGTNISVRTTGGTNFIDVTGQLNNWAQFTTNVWNSRQGGSAALTNIAGLSSTVFTNVPLGGTNISVRTAGGTNFFDVTGQLNNWANFTTNVWNDRQGGSAVLTNLAGNTIPYTNIIVGGTGITLTTNSGQVTIASSGVGVVPAITFTPNYGALFGSDGVSSNWVSEPNGGWVLHEEFDGDTRVYTGNAENPLGSRSWWHLTTGTLPLTVYTPGINLGSEWGAVSMVATQATSAQRFYIGPSSTTGLMMFTNADYFAVMAVYFGQTNNANNVSTFYCGFSDNVSSVSATLFPNEFVGFLQNTNATNTVVCKTSRSGSHTLSYTSFSYTPNVRYFLAFYLSKWNTNVIFYAGTNFASLSPIATNTANIPSPAVFMKPDFLSGRMTASAGNIPTTNIMGAFHVWRKTYD